VPRAQVGMSSTLFYTLSGSAGQGDQHGEVLIGIDPHKATNALAAIDERGKLLESTPFSPPTEPVSALACALLGQAFPGALLGGGRCRRVGAFRGPAPGVAAAERGSWTYLP
jgi:hypothetical protein